MWLSYDSLLLIVQVRRLDNDRTYVMKQIDISEMSHRAQLDAAKEAQILARMRSKYVVKYYDSFVDDEKLCIVMEYCDGGDLQRFLKQQDGAPVPEPLVWRLFIQICLGLHYLHSHRVLHRDMKSANVFLHGEYGVKIGDLGVARVLGTHTHFARTCVGTPFYLSPELCEDRPYNEKSDVWALGCILYEMCTLKHPFDARNQGALILKILSGQYPPIGESYSPLIHKWVDRLLTRDSRLRPSVRDLLAEEEVVQQATWLGIGLPDDVRAVHTPIERMSTPSRGEESDDDRGSPDRIRVHRDKMSRLLHNDESASRAALAPGGIARPPSAEHCTPIPRHRTRVAHPGKGPSSSPSSSSRVHPGRPPTAGAVLRPPGRSPKPKRVGPEASAALERAKEARRAAARRRRRSEPSTSRDKGDVAARDETGSHPEDDEEGRQGREAEAPTTTAPEAAAAAGLSPSSSDRRARRILAQGSVRDALGSASAGKDDNVSGTRPMSATATRLHEVSPPPVPLQASARSGGRRAKRHSGEPLSDTRGAEPVAEEIQAEGEDTVDRRDAGWDETVRTDTIATEPSLVERFASSLALQETPASEGQVCTEVCLGPSDSHWPGDSFVTEHDSLEEVEEGVDETLRGEGTVRSFGASAKLGLAKPGDRFGSGQGESFSTTALSDAGKGAGEEAPGGRHPPSHAWGTNRANNDTFARRLGLDDDSYADDSFVEEPTPRELDGLTQLSSTLDAPSVSTAAPKEPEDSDSGKSADDGDSAGSAEVEDEEEEDGDDEEEEDGDTGSDREEEEEEEEDDEEEDESDESDDESEEESEASESGEESGTGSDASGNAEAGAGGKARQSRTRPLSSKGTLQEWERIVSVREQALATWLPDGTLAPRLASALACDPSRRVQRRLESRSVLADHFLTVAGACRRRLGSESMTQLHSILTPGDGSPARPAADSSSATSSPFSQTLSVLGKFEPSVQHLVFQCIHYAGLLRENADQLRAVAPSSRFSATAPSRG